MGKHPGLARGLAWGDIRLVELSAPDKTRPALILSRSAVLPYLNAVTVAPITSTVRGHDAELLVGVEEGLKGRSVVKLDSLLTISKARIGRYLGALDPSRREELRRALLFALELD